MGKIIEKTKMKETEELKIPKSILKEIKHLEKTGIPRCHKCKKNMKNGYDSILKRLSKYIWEFDCDCLPKGKRPRLMTL